MKTIIAGSRNITDPSHVWNAVRQAQADGLRITEVVTGGCRGVDAIAHDGAMRKGVATRVFEAQWNEHGRAAGPIRNREMAEYAATCDEGGSLIALPMGKSTGTRGMIELARRYGLRVWVYEVNDA